MSTKKQTLLRFESLADLGKPGWWRYLVSFICISVFGSLLQIPFIGILLAVSFDWKSYFRNLQTGLSNSQVIEDFNQKVDFNKFGSSTQILALLASSGVMIIAIWFALKFIHRRKLLTIVTNRTTFSWSRVWTGFWVYSLVSICIILVGIGLALATNTPNTIIWTNQNLLNYILFLLAAIPLLFFQVTAEEMMFRGYIFQSVYKSATILQSKVRPQKKPLLRASAIIAGLFSVLAFGFIHFANGSFKVGVWVALGYFAAAVFFQWITYKDQRIELSIGGHLANNLLAFTIIGNTFDGANSSLFTDIASAGDANTPFTPLFGVIPFALFYWIVFILLPKLTKKPNNV
jgi:uncharacterized protein